MCKLQRVAHKLNIKLWLHSGPEVINVFSCSTQLSMKFHLVIKIKKHQQLNYFHAQLSWACSAELGMKEVLKNGCILRFISKINFVLSWVEHEKKFITSGPVCEWFSGVDTLIKSTKRKIIPLWSNRCTALHLNYSDSAICSTALGNVFVLGNSSDLSRKSYPIRYSSGLIW